MLAAMVVPESKLLLAPWRSFKVTVLPAVGSHWIVESLPASGLKPLIGTMKAFSPAAAARAERPAMMMGITEEKRILL